VCLEAPRRFHAVGQFYRSFLQLADDEVIALLQQARQAQAKDAR
jgi:predicted phosphoribosyltransferase